MKNKMRQNKKILGISLIFLFFFLLTLTLMMLGFFQKIDSSLQNYFSNPESPFFISLSLILSSLFEPLTVIGFSIFLSLLLFFKGFKRESLFLSTASVFGGIFIILLKEVVQRIRPENLYESGFGFPSGHATMAILFFSWLIYSSTKHFGKKNRVLISILSSILVLAIISSRIYLGVHWFSDILGGIFLGTFLFCFILSFFRSR